MNTRFTKNKKVFIIAEAGVNHNGKLSVAKQLVDVAIYANADAVKFQTFKLGELTGKFAFKVAYQKEATGDNGSRYEMSRQLALSYKEFAVLQRYCHVKGILFLSTPDGYESLDFLVDKLRMPIIKISSTEMTHLEFLKAAAKKNRPIILSTGMSTLKEVKRAVKIIKTYNKKELAILHCTTEYPAPYSEVNLKAMVTLGSVFKTPIGYSDHTIGKETAIAAVALGAKIIEKHFTLNKNLEGPDHKASLEPHELKDFVSSVRIAEQILGDGIKRPSASEKKNIPGVRRGIVAARYLPKGTILKKDMLNYKRPNTGIQPESMDKIIGKKTIKDLEEDEVLRWAYLR